jgi:hypothetical protein
VNPFRFQAAEERLVAARSAIAELSAAPCDVSMLVSLRRTAGDIDEAGRLFHEAHLLFIKIENLLTIIEWQIERLSPPHWRDQAQS